MSERELAKERRSRRREWDAGRENERLDHRATRSARFKKITVHISVTGEGKALAEACADRMNLGAGMNLSVFTEYLWRKWAKEGARMFKSVREEESG